MMFLGGVFVPTTLLPTGLRIVAHVLPLTYAVEALRVAMQGGSFASAALDLVALAFFTAVLFGPAVRVLARRME
jgi:ABC-2 type transport system permease protein